MIPPEEARRRYRQTINTAVLIGVGLGVAMSLMVASASLIIAEIAKGLPQ